MSKDRSIATDALEVLGLPDLGGKTVGRDAIHLAVEPATAAVVLLPGQSIRIVDGLWHPAWITDGPLKRTAIVDPFLAEPVRPGGRFLAIIPPRQITSLRHVWSHPEFPEEAASGAPSDEPESSPAMFQSSKEESEAWLRDFVKRSGCPSYEEVIGAAAGHPGSNCWDDDYLHFSGVEAHGEIPPEFWDHLEIVTGRKFSVRATYFSCSC